MWIVSEMAPKSKLHIAISITGWCAPTKHCGTRDGVAPKKLVFVVHQWIAPVLEERRKERVRVSVPADRRQMRKGGNAWQWKEGDEAACGERESRWTITAAYVRTRRQTTDDAGHLTRADRESPSWLLTCCRPHAPVSLTSLHQNRRYDILAPKKLYFSLCSFFATVASLARRISDAANPLTMTGFTGSIEVV